MGNWERMAVMAVVVAALLACKRSEDSAQGEPPAPPATPATATVAEPAAAPTPAPASAQGIIDMERAADDDVGCPACPPKMRGAGLKTSPPKINEWNEVGEISVRHSTPLKCETKMVREWLKVKCTGDDVKGVAITSSSGDWGSIPPYSTAGNANIVVALRRNVKLRVRYDWTWGSRTLSVDFPSGAAQPTIEFDASRP